VKGVEVQRPSVRSSEDKIISPSMLRTDRDASKSFRTPTTASLRDTVRTLPSWWIAPPLACSIVKTSRPGA
jgi:hypothetical protein